MYLLRVKGSDKTSGLLQIRDEDFSMLACFREKNLDEELEKNNLLHLKKKIKEALAQLDYGTIKKIR